MTAVANPKSKAKPKSSEATKPTKPAKTPKTPKTPAVRAGITASQVREAAETLKALAEPTRLTVLFALAERPNGANVGELVAAMNTTQPAMSHHLSILRLARMAEGTRAAKHVVYTVTAQGARLLASLEPVLNAPA